MYFFCVFVCEDLCYVVDSCILIVVGRRYLIIIG